MSEQTPNSSEDLSGAEPSMEDILASIRKIISEDEPMAMESPEDLTPEIPSVTQSVEAFAGDTLKSDAVLDAESFGALDAAEGESVDLDIDDVLAGLEGDILDPEVVASAATIEPVAFEAASMLDDDVSEFETDIGSFLDDEPSAIEVVAESADSVGLETSTFDAVDDDDQMSALLDDILLESETAASEETFDVETFEAAPIETASAETDADLDLVKSLMADLADDPDSLDTGSFDSPEDFEAEEDLDALLAIPDVEDLPVDMGGDDFIVATDSADVSQEDDILGDILNTTLDDELSAQPDDIFSAEDVARIEESNLVENAEMDELLAEMDSFDDASLEDTADLEIPDDTIEDDLPSLADIAAAAEADAVAAETPSLNPLAAVGGLAAAGAGFVAVATNTEDDIEPEIQAEVETLEAELQDLVEPELVEPELQDLVEPELVEPEFIEPEALEAALNETNIEAEVIETEAVEAEVSEVETLETAASVAPTSETIVEPSTSTQTLPSQETSMPVKAVKSETILNEVTETATSGAFAELNAVVEDKAIFNERGPRIGDLVQDALRPMLKEWLDANLKGIVERAVTKEVKRISSGK